MPREVRNKDLSFLHQASKDPENHDSKKAVARYWARSHRAYLTRLKHKPPVKLSATLPIAEKYGEIEEALYHHAVIIVSGETGSGKSTQLPQLALKLGRGVAGRIALTQPRRIAARALAHRLSEELQVPVGKEVGFKIRHNSKISPETYIKVLTDGMLLAEIAGDRLLNEYDTIIVDEAHERTLNIDFLLGYLKKILQERPDLKVVITSATLNADIVRSYFNEAPVIHVSGRSYPVVMEYAPLEEQDEDGLTLSLPEAIVQQVERLWQKERGDVLVFLPGEGEIRDAVDALEESGLKKAIFLPLYAQLPQEAQDKIFHPDLGLTRVILATNIAETSLTVPRIRYVIDSGLVRVKRYLHASKIDQLQIEKISQAAAKQRAGRAGRERAGLAVRLYSEDDFNQRPAFSDPEILRSNLSQVILKMAYLGLGALTDFPLLDPPKLRAIKSGEKELRELGAFDSSNAITAMGKEMAKLNLDPRLSRILVAARPYKEIYDILVILAVLSIPDPRVILPEERNAAKAAHALFEDEHSDFYSYLNLWYAYQAQKKQVVKRRQLAAWCKTHHLSFRRMTEWNHLMQEMAEAVCLLGYKVQPADRKELDEQEKHRYEKKRYQHIHQLLLYGMTANIGERSLHAADKGAYLGVKVRRFFIHSSSALRKKNPRWLMAATLLQSNQVFALRVARILPEWIEKPAQALVKYRYGVPFWSENRGETVVEEEAFLYGKKILSRQISLGGKDPIKAREIFIREGLIGKKLHLNSSFYPHNQRLFKTVENFQARQRRQSFALEETFFNLYKERLPEHVWNSCSLINWIKKDAKRRNRLLSFTLEEVIDQTERERVETLYPDSWSFGENTLSLQYHFKMGHPLDGISVVVPIILLKNLQAAPFEWLVPGLIREKITLLLKALPGRIKRYITPLPQFITEFLSTEPDQQASLLSALYTQVLRRVGDETLLAGIDWQKLVASLPDFTRMNFIVVDEYDRELAMGRDLTVLKHNLKRKIEKQFSVANIDKSLEKEEVKRWDFGDIGQSIVLQRGNQKINAYLALKKEGNKVALRLFNQPETALEAHKEGILALARLILIKQIRQSERLLNNLTEVSLGLEGLYTSDQLVKEIIATSLKAIILPPGQAIPQYADLFQERINAGHQLVQKVGMLASHVKETSYLYRQLRSKLGQHVLTPIIQKQLEALVYPGFIVKTPWEQWSRFNVYLQAMMLRLEKYGDRQTQDAAHEEAIQALHQAWQSAFSQKKERDLPIPSSWLDFRWKMEELRISLFAQELKTPYRISIKRLQKIWQEIKEQ